MKFQLFERVAFSVDVPGENIRRGDVATIVECFEEPKPSYALEIFNAVGKTVGIVAVPESALEPLSEDERISVRRIRAAA